MDAQNPQTVRGDLPATAVVMPVYNEGSVVRGVIAELVGLGLTVIAVDDGSSDNSAAEIDAAGGIRVTHPINLGQGGALQTGFEAAIRFTTPSSSPLSTRTVSTRRRTCSA